MSAEPTQTYNAAVTRLRARRPGRSVLDAAARGAQRMIVRVAPRVGLRTTPDSFYSPIPELPPW
jgi:hypothetical protein